MRVVDKCKHGLSVESICGNCIEAAPRGKPVEDKWPPRKMVNGRQAVNMGNCTVGEGWVQMLSLAEHQAEKERLEAEIAELKENAEGFAISFEWIAACATDLSQAKRYAKDCASLIRTGDLPEALRAGEEGK